MNNQQRTFERRRLDFFEKCGVELEPRRVGDRRQDQTYLLDSGGDGTPVLMIHGGGCQALEWVPLASRLAQKRRLLLVDRPGCGLSGPVDYRERDVRRSASEWLADIVDDLDLEEVDIVANSMGSFFGISYILSVQHHHRVRRLVFAGAPTGIDRWMPYPLRAMATPGLNRVVFALAGEPDVSMMRTAFRRRLVENPGRLSERFLQIMAAGARLPGADVGWRSLLEACVDLGGFRRRYLLRGEMSSIEIPTLFVWGEQDAYASPDSGAELVDQMPAARLRRVAAAGHLPWFDQPGRVARSIGTFLEKSENEELYSGRQSSEIDEIETEERRRRENPGVDRDGGRSRPR